MAEEKDTQRKSGGASKGGGASSSRGRKARTRTKSAATKTAAGSTAKKPASGATKAKPKAPAKKTKAPSTKSAATKAAAGSTEAKPKAPAKKTKAEAKPKAKAAAKEAPQRPVVNARARFVRVAPRKARMVANQVRGLPIDDARALLRFSSRGAARDIVKLIDSAVANAEANHDLVADDLLIKDIHVDDGPTLRRYRPRALGRATRINKRTSHIAVALTPEE
jgi:large subunit ribosomal protein L22